MTIKHLCRWVGIYAVLLAAFSGCGSAEQEFRALVPQVAFMTAAPVTLQLTEDLPGRVAPVRIAEIRAQVSGIVERRLFEQGADIRAGQPLFQINPAPLRAELDTAAAALRRAQASLARATTQAERLQPLVEADAVSQQVYDDAVAQREEAAADVAQARSMLLRRRLDLGFATVASPISGRIDQALITEGALVSSTDSSPMARVQQIDQVYVDLRRPASSLDTLRQALASASARKDGVSVAILDTTRTPCELTGRILFSGINVDASTGDVLLRVLVDNPQHRLLPGMFVHARVPYASYVDALTVPQQAVVRIGGKPHLWTVDRTSKVQLVAVELGELVNRSYRVKSGLTAGQRIVVEGMERLSDGVDVSAQPWGASSSSAIAATL